jgi:hypothetical protein
MDGIPLRVVKYADLLEKPGDSLRCFLDNREQFGYLMTHDKAGEYWIDVISNGKLEGEKSRMKAVLKDYGSPFAVYLSVYKRQEDYGSYFELLLWKKWSPYTTTFPGDVMFTEAYYSKAGEKEHETLKPIFKKPLHCDPGNGAN